jgi:pimeloyl-ACP methyl ester carboxylesterase
MPFASTDDGVKLFYEEAGSGTPILFIHEFAGDLGSWEPQVQHFSRRYRCITYNARGYPPSDVPPTPASYSQKRAVRDALAVLDHLGVAKAHIVGLSMGGFATLHIGLDAPERAHSLCVAGCGYGAEPGKREQFRSEAEAAAAMLLEKGMDAFVDRYAFGPTRVQFQNNDPRGFAKFMADFKKHSALGSANTQLGVQRERPSLFDLREAMAKLRVPVLILNGDEDWPCLMPGMMMKEVIPSAAMAIIPNAGHTINIETPDAFNHAVSEFLAWVESGRWPVRDVRATGKSILGMLK